METLKSQENIDLKRGVDFTGITCVFICHDGRGRILLNKRSQKCRDEQGRWDNGAGALEFGEDFEAAVRREIKEEYCADVEELHFIGVRNVLRDNDGMQTHWVAIIFAALVKPEMVGIGDPVKMDEIGWFEESSLPEPLHSQFLTHFELVKKAGVFQPRNDA